MAYLLKEGKTYTDKMGVSHSFAYSAIDEIINSKRKKEATIILKIYASKELANEGMEPFETETITVEGEEWENRLSPTAISNDDNEFKQAYLFFDDCVIILGGFIKNDWQADE